MKKYTILIMLILGIISISLFSSCKGNKDNIDGGGKDPNVQNREYTATLSAAG
ncbi:MAG: hypothetical protein J6W64_06475 [Bacilli bacterium]|nr:hypothetical protein [Bacilli bacterium]